MSLLTHNLLSKHPTELDKVLDLFGYTSFINHFAFVPFSLISLLGLIGNIIGVLATHRLVNECPTYGIYRILRVYCLNSSIACFLFMFTFIGYSIFYFPWIMSEQAASFMILIYIPMSNLGYFYSSALDILMTLERVCVLKGRTQLVRMDRINSFCLITLLVLLIIEIPFFLRYEPASLTIRIESKSVNGSLSHDESSIRWWYVGFTSFSLSRVGRVLVIAGDIFRDVVFTLLEILLNMISIYYLRIYSGRKRRLTLSGQSHGGSKLARSKTQARITQLAICMSFLSVVEHIMVIRILVYPYTAKFVRKKFMRLSLFVFLVISLKHGSNFIVLYAFNSKFRQVCNQEFKSRLVYFRQTK